MPRLAVALLFAAMIPCLRGQTKATFPDDTLLKDLGPYEILLNGYSEARVSFCDPKETGGDDRPNFGPKSFGKLLHKILPQRPDGSYIVKSGSVSKWRVNGLLNLMNSIAKISDQEALKGDSNNGLMHPMAALRSATSELILFTRAAHLASPDIQTRLSALHSDEATFFARWAAAKSPAGEAEKKDYGVQMRGIQKVLDELIEITAR